MTGHRERQLTGTFGTETGAGASRARIEDETGKVTEWRSNALPRYQRLTRKAEAPDSRGLPRRTNTRCVSERCSGLFEGAVSKDVVSRDRRKVKVDWDRVVRAQPRLWTSFASFLDGIRDQDPGWGRKTTNISVLAAHRRAQRRTEGSVTPSETWAGRSTAAWRQFLMILMPAA